MTPLSTDVKGLNQGFQVRIELEPRWNSDNPKKSTFVPIYVVSWVSEQNRREGYGSVTSVKLFAPTKTLVNLRVEDSDYILRKPLAFTDLDILLAVPKSK